MLDAKDLEAIAALLDTKMDAKFEAFEAKMDAKMDAKFEAFEAKMDAKMDAKFEAFEAKMDAKMNAKFEAFEAKMDTKFKTFKDELLEEVDRRIEVRVNKCESNLLTEMERLYQRTNDKIDAINKRLDKLESRYHAIRIEQNNTTLIMQMITTLQRDVEEIKLKIA